MNIPNKNILIGAVAALALVGAWYMWRDYNSKQFDASIGFDYNDYITTASDSTNWDNYEPLSLEVPK